MLIIGKIEFRMRKYLIMHLDAGSPPELVAPLSTKNIELRED